MCICEAKLSSVSHMPRTNNCDISICLPGGQIEMSLLLLRRNSQLESISHTLLLNINYPSAFASFVSQPDNKSGILARKAVLSNILKIVYIIFREGVIYLKDTSPMVVLPMRRRHLIFCPAKLKNRDL